jgi:hypothetical protein
MPRANEQKIIEDLTRMAKTGANRREMISRATLEVPEEKAEHFLREVIMRL